MIANLLELFKLFLSVAVSIVLKLLRTAISHILQNFGNQMALKVLNFQKYIFYLNL